MDVEPGSPGEPGLDLGVFVGAVVVDDEMDVQVFGDAVVDVPQEGEELLVPVAPLALGEHRTGRHVEGGEQGGGAMADVIVGDAIDVAESHGQQGLGALEGLDLGFLVHAQHDGVIGGVEIQPHDVAHLLDEERVVGEFEMALAVRLHAEQPEPPLHGGLGDAGMFGHGADAPMGCIGRPVLQRGVDHLCDTVVLVGTGAAGAQFVVETFEALFEVPAAPFADGDVADTEPLRDGGVGLAIGAGEDDLGPSHDAVGQ